MKYITLIGTLSTLVNAVMAFSEHKTEAGLAWTCAFLFAFGVFLREIGNK